MMYNKYLMNDFNEISAVISSALKVTKLSHRKVVKLLDKVYYITTIVVDDSFIHLFTYTFINCLRMFLSGNMVGPTNTVVNPSGHIPDLMVLKM